ncbi:zinc ribbon domain-containing protein [Collinsella tanakaei]|uniref:zinc ribbon domain-containing protein n=1 Tax=Collinsella tanakaei TaxID=626935 RepID=UPI0025A49867|nr:zinc ribbon domain-containing protein [Collinsella tanakaei]MDM8300090.1 zinc-ribbon domain-containing protein [Collinsella tanakaei]
MFCPACGGKISDTAKFCPLCGAELIRGVEAKPAEAPTPEAAAEPAVPDDAAEPAPSGGPVPTDTSAPVPPQTPPASVPGDLQQPASLATASTPPKRRGARIALVAAAAAILVVGAIALFAAFAPDSIKQSLPGVGQLSPVETPEFNTGDIVTDGTYDYYFSPEHGGIVRAAVDGSGVKLIYPVVLGSDSPVFTLSALSLDGDDLYFCLSYLRSDASRHGMSLEDDLAEMHRIRTDGSNDTVIFSLEAGNYDNDDIVVGIFLVPYARDGKVYTVIRTTYYNPKNEEQQIVCMDSDGGNLENLGLIRREDGARLALWPDCMGYAPGRYLYQDEETVYTELYLQNLDGTGIERVYTTSGGSISSFMRNAGKLYVLETGGEAYRLVSMNEDGSDAQTAIDFATLPSDAELVQLVSVRDNTALVVLSYRTMEGPFEFRLSEMALDGSGEIVSETAIAYEDIGLYSIYDFDGRLVAYEGSMSEPDGRADAFMIDEDGVPISYE